MSKSLHNDVTRLITAVTDWLHAWWRVDRIDTSPRHGRLLRITPGSVLCIAGTLLEITHRTIHVTAQGSQVQYHCRGPDGESEFWIRSEESSVIRWLRGTKQQELYQDEIEVFGPDCGN